MSDTVRPTIGAPHPIVAQMAPSEEQMPAVLERGRDIIVTAGAGTGKTRTLVARYISLLAEGITLRRILAITFTRKAAREMRNRVRDEVRRYLALPGLEDTERRHWQTLYSQLDAARIGTIHSFCSEVLRAHPAEARVDPRFEVLDEAQMTILRRQAIDEAMSWAADDQAAVTLFAVLGERSLRTLLDDLLARRLEVAEALSTADNDLLTHWERELRSQQTTRLAELFDSAEWKTTVEALTANEAQQPDDRMEMQRLAVVRAIRALPSTLKDRLAALAPVGQIDLRGGRQGAWPGGRAQLDEVKNALRTLRSLWQQHAGLLELDLGPADEALARMQLSLEVTFDTACQHYDAIKRERNALDFDDLEGSALALLRDNSDVRDRWQDEIDAVLVDEFQDTNSRQRDLVARLNGNRGRLFIVGDAKQSIYRFRGADVTVFRHERQRIEREGGAVFALDTSYRAHRDLIHGLNDLLRPVVGDQDDPQRPWAEPFAALSFEREEPGPGFREPHIELHLAVGTKGSGALARAAAALADRISELVESGAAIRDGDQERPLDYGDFAILCRASVSFAHYENALEQSGVPFLTVAGRGFYGRPEIRDLLNAMQALADPTDDLALVGLLRSPAIGLSDAALYTLREHHRHQPRKVSLWCTLQEGGILSGEDGRLADRAARLIADLHRRVGRTTVADVLKAFLDTTDYRAALVQAGQTRSARNVAKLLADAHASNLVGIGEFLEYVTGLRDTGTREGEARATAEGAVQIMSVHAAKGLEFPVVVIGDVTHQGRRTDSTLLQPGLGVLLPVCDDEGQLPAVYRLGKMLEEDQEAAEIDRLLYVAATRAREKLILSGCLTLDSSGRPSRLGEWLGRMGAESCLDLADLQLDYDEEGSAAIDFTLEVGATPASCTIYESRYRRKFRAARVEPPSKAPVTLPPPLLQPVSPGHGRADDRTVEQDRSPPRRVWRVVPGVARPSAPARVVGSMVHQALGAWRFPGEGFEAWAEARARGFGLTDLRQLRDAVRQTHKLLTRFRQHPLFQEMNTAERRLHEVPYCLTVDDQVENGIIDAMFYRDDGWTIVEFKTDDVRSEAALEALLAREDYLEQAERYIMAAERLLGKRPRCFLCLLNYRGTVRTIEV